MIETISQQAPRFGGCDARQRRTRRLFSAWITLAPSKAMTLLVQLIAIPTVYRAIGPAQFSAYAAVTAAVSILGFLHMGMGGALVTPLAQAAADGDHGREVELLGSTVIPIVVLAALALCVTLPLIMVASPKLLLGASASVASPQALRTATLFACIGTLLSVPLSVVENVRQAYQEIHIQNLFGTLSNALLCIGLLMAAWFTPTLAGFVAVAALLPTTVRLVNALSLFARRPYLMSMCKRPLSLSSMRHLAGDGVSYMAAAAFANILIYQWPIYYMARTRPPLESSTFAVCVQFFFLLLSFCVSLALPLWPAVADAVARADRPWVLRTIRSARVLALASGAAGLLILGFTMNAAITIWLHRPFHVSSAVCWLFGCYLLLAIWEYVHWPLTLGHGAIRAASKLVFLRSVMFAALVPFAARYGPTGVVALLCASIVAVSAGWFPWLLSSRMRTVWQNA